MHLGCAGTDTKWQMESLLQVGGIINLHEKNEVTSMCCNNNLE